MASRRMFGKDFVLSDKFQDLPASAKALYLAFGVCCDDEGFSASPQGILRHVGGTADDLETLVQAGFVLSFPSGAICLVHWNENNKIRSDRFTPTVCIEERSLLGTDQSGAYFILDD